MLLRKIKFHFLKFKRKSHPYAPAEPPYKHCKNCGNELHGKYCSVCGQFAHMENRPFTDSVKFYLEHHYALDHKLGHTLFNLFFRPGFLVNEFMKGRIERYVHPIKLYFFASILLFGIVVGVTQSKESSNKPLIDTQSKVVADKQIIALKDSLAKHKNDLSKTEIKAINQKLDSLRNLAIPIQITIDKNSKKDSSSFENKLIKGLTTTSKDELEHRFFHYLSIAMLFMMPLFGTFLMISYRSREKYYTAHLIHSIHLHSVLFIAISIAVLIEHYFTNVTIQQWLLLAWFIYYVLSLSKYYKKGIVSSLFKGMMLLGLYLMVSTAAVIAVLLLSIVG